MVDVMLIMGIREEEYDGLSGISTMGKGWKSIIALR